MSVKKIFITLIVIVLCVMIGALLLNVLFPNAAKALVNATENMIYNATGMSFDFNGDGQGANGNYGDMATAGAETGANGGANVTGFEGGG